MYIGGFVLLKFIEPVTFARCASYICIAQEEITLGGYFDTRRNI